MRVFKKIADFLKKKSESDSRLFDKVSSLTGYNPKNLNLYKLALRHSSMIAGQSADNTISSTANVAGLSGKNHNERLEYLGDAILGAIIAEYLFKKYPYKDEGFLTDIRSRIVNRESLNSIARKVGIDTLVEYDTKQHRNLMPHKSIYGDAMEAFIGAFYLDHGFMVCKNFIIAKIIDQQLDMAQLIREDTNHKSRLIEWAQRAGKKVRFELLGDATNSYNKEFSCQVFIDDMPYGCGSGYSKKKAEQLAAAATLSKLV